MKNKRKQFNLLGIGLFLFGVIMVINSCTPESFVKPKLMQDETDVPGHGVWNKVVFKFREGHPHGDVFHGHPMPEEYKEVNYLKTYQELSLEWGLDEEGRKVVKKSHENPIRFMPKMWYALEILYYDKNDSLMNYQYTSTPKLASTHQHFLMPLNGKDIKTNEIIPKEEILSAIDYEYRDTEPSDYVRKEEDDNTHLRDKQDPMGFKGYFFEARGGVSFDLNIQMVHILIGDKRSTSGRAYPFNRPPGRFMPAFDMAVMIPIRVFTKYGMDDHFEDQILIDDIAREFNISTKAAKKEFDAKYYGGVDKHASDYYL